MKALEYNGALALNPKYPNPTPGEDECLLRVRLAGISDIDLNIIQGLSSFRGVLGHEVVATVERGPDKWRGRRIVCEINGVCRACDMCLAGLSNHCRRRTIMGIKDRDGCLAEWLVMPARNLHAVPDGLTDDEAVFVEPLAGAHQILIQCPIDRRMNVSVIGPGLQGWLVAQLLRSTGCKLTVVGRDPVQLDRCEKKGIQSIPLDECVPRQDRDVVVVGSGTPENLAIATALVRPRGTIVVKSPDAHAGPRPVPRGQAHGPAVHGESPAPIGETDQAMAAGDQPPRCFDLDSLVANEITLIGSRCGPFPQAIEALARGAVEVTSMISRVFDLDDAVAAMTHAGEHTNAKTLIRVSS